MEAEERWRGGLSAKTLEQRRLREDARLLPHYSARKLAPLLPLLPRILPAVTGLDTGNSSTAYARLREQSPEVTTTSSLLRDAPILTCVKGVTHERDYPISPPRKPHFPT